MEISCPAKLNLVLEVLGRRADGYREIRTIFQAVDFADRLELQPHTGSGLQLALRGEGSVGVSSGEENLVHRAYIAFQRAFGPVPGLAVTLTKSIPPGSGLGGGSSDAAAMLLALRWICNRPGTTGELEAVAGGLGSDVPFFLHGGTALGTGRGECVTALPDAAKHLVLLVLPEKAIRSEEVYRCFDPMLTSGSNRISIHRYLDETGGVCLHREFQRNDLESVVFRMHPALRRLKDLLYDTGAGFASLSGSGSGLFGLYDSRARASAAARRFEAGNSRTVLTCFLGREAHGTVLEGPV